MQWTRLKRRNARAGPYAFVFCSFAKRCELTIAELILLLFECFVNDGTRECGSDRFVYGSGGLFDLGGKTGWITNWSILLSFITFDFIMWAEQSGWKGKWGLQIASQRLCGYCYCFCFWCYIFLLRCGRHDYCCLKFRLPFSYRFAYLFVIFFNDKQFIVEALERMRTESKNHRTHLISNRARNIRARKTYFPLSHLFFAHFPFRFLPDSRHLIVFLLAIFKNIKYLLAPSILMVERESLNLYIYTYINKKKRRRRITSPFPTQSKGNRFVESDRWNGGEEGRRTNATLD